MTWYPVPQITAPRYVDSKANNTQRVINWFYEKTDRGMILKSAHGLSLLDSVANDQACRGAWFSPKGSGHLISVHGNTVYSISAAGADTARSVTLSTSSGEICFAENNADQVLFVDGQYGYIFDLSGLTVTKITDGNFPTSPVSCMFMNGRFWVVNGSTAQAYASQLEDGLDWTPQIFASMDSAGDDLVACESSNSTGIFFGNTTIEFWSGMDLDPYIQPISGATIPIGLAYKSALAKSGDKIGFIGVGKGTRTGFYILQGSHATLISTPDINTRIEDWEFGSAYVSAYMNEGNEFFEFVNPSGVYQGWQYNLTTGTWVELDYANRPVRMALNAYNGTNSDVPVYAFSRTDGKVYHLDRTAYTFNGTAITKILDFSMDSGIGRVLQAGFRIEFDVKSGGVGTYSFGATLQWSNDGTSNYNTGFTVSKTVSDGITILTFPPLGSFKAGRCFRLTITGPNARVILRQAESLHRLGRF